MINRKEQIHAAIYNAVVDAGFSLYVTLGSHQEYQIWAKDLLEDTPDFKIAFTGKDISDVDVELDNGIRMGA